MKKVASPACEEEKERGFEFEFEFEFELRLRCSGMVVLELVVLF